MTTHAISRNALATDAQPLRRLGELVLNTRRDAAPAFLRIAIAVLLFPHGAQHFLGWFDGYGFAGTHEWMTETLGFHPALAALAITGELIAPIALLFGAGSRLAALGVIGLMLGAVSTHAANGFFMNWFGALPAGAEGYEYHLLMIAAATAVLLQGSGAWSIDRRLSRSWAR